LILCFGEVLKFFSLHFGVYEVSCKEMYVLLPYQIKSLFYDILKLVQKSWCPFSFSSVINSTMTTESCNRNMLLNIILPCNFDSLLQCFVIVYGQIKLRKSKCCNGISDNFMTFILLEWKIVLSQPTHMESYQ